MHEKIWLGWSTIPNEIKNAWCDWKTKINQLEDISIRRCFKLTILEEIAECSFYHISNVLEKGYSQSSYICILDVQERITCVLVIGKARVSPLKFVSIPRTELAAAVLSVKIASLIQKELDMRNTKHYFWTDRKVCHTFKATVEDSKLSSPIECDK